MARRLAFDKNSLGLLHLAERTIQLLDPSSAFGWADSVARTHVHALSQQLPAMATTTIVRSRRLDASSLVGLLELELVVVVVVLQLCLQVVVPRGVLVVCERGFRVVAPL